MGVARLTDLPAEPLRAGHTVAMATLGAVITGTNPLMPLGPTSPGRESPDRGSPRRWTED